MKTITTGLVAIISGMMAVYLYALMTLPTTASAQNYTDYNDHAASEQISAEWEAKAKAEWIAEYGDAQPNLTTESRIYLEKTTALLQDKRDEQ